MMTKNSAMSYSFLIANGTTHHNKKKVQVNLGYDTLKYVSGGESQLIICFKYFITQFKGYWKCFTNVNLLNPHKNPVKYVLLVFSLWKLRHREVK